MLPKAGRKRGRAFGFVAMLCLLLLLGGLALEVPAGRSTSKLQEKHSASRLGPSTTVNTASSSGVVSPLPSTQNKAPNITRKKTIPIIHSESSPPPSSQPVGTARESAERLSRAEMWTIFGVVVAMAGLIALVLFEMRRRAENRQKICDAAYVYLDFVSPGKIRSQTQGADNVNPASFIDDFFVGKDVDNCCLRYVSLDLDARRECLLKDAKEKLSRAKRGPQCIQIVGPRQQGKTMLMARLAYDAAKNGADVYWVWADRSKEACQHWSDLKAFFHVRTHLWPLGNRRRYVFVDDVFSPRELAEDTASAERDARNLLSALGNTNTTIVCSSVKAIFPNVAVVETIGMEDGKGDSELDLNEQDARAIVDKWRKAGHLTEGEASEFLDNVESKKLYKKRLFAFLCVLFETAEASTNHSFMTKFGRELVDVVDPLRNVLPIAACQVADVPVPKRVIEVMDPAFAMDHSIVTRSSYEHNSEDEVYVMDGLFLPRWLLRRQAIGKYTDLVSVYGSLVDACKKVPNFGFRASEKSFFPNLLHGLARGMNEDIVGGHGKDVARIVFDQHKDYFTDQFREVVKPRAVQSELISWGWAFKSLMLWNLAADAYLAAAAQKDEYTSLGDRLRLLNGLKDLPLADSRRKAVPIAEALLRDLMSDKEDRDDLLKAFTAYCDLLLNLNQPDVALSIWKKFQDEHVLEPDAMLYTWIGTLFEALGEAHVKEACEAYCSAARLAKVDIANPRKGAHALRRYAVFLGHHCPPGCPSPEEAFANALDFAHTHHVDDSDILRAMAEYQMNQRNFAEARALYRKAIEGSRTRNYAPGYACIGLANLLINHWKKLDDQKPESMFEEAESLLDSLENDGNCLPHDKLIARRVRSDIVGWAQVPYCFGGRQRPDLEEAKGYLLRSFESPEGLMDDPEAKTFEDSQVHKKLTHVLNAQLENEYQSARSGTGNLGRVQELAASLEFHARKAFEGLPREDTPGNEVRVQVLRMKSFLAFFLWHEKRKYFPGSLSIIDCQREAYELYREGILQMELWGWSKDGGSLGKRWRFACETYLNFAAFRCAIGSSLDNELFETCEATLTCFPNAEFDHSGPNQVESVVRFLIDRSKSSTQAPKAVQERALAAADLANKLALVAQESFPDDASIALSLIPQASLNAERLRRRLHLPA